MHRMSSVSKAVSFSHSLAYLSLHRKKNLKYQSKLSASIILPYTSVSAWRTTPSFPTTTTLLFSISVAFFFSKFKIKTIRLLKCTFLEIFVTVYRIYLISCEYVFLLFSVLLSDCYSWLGLLLSSVLLTQCTVTPNLDCCCLLYFCTSYSLPLSVLCSRA